jgi:FKBP-type peptidyl-prolyl cis-trans isomerase FkpA
MAQTPPAGPQAAPKVAPKSTAAPAAKSGVATKSATAPRPAAPALTTDDQKTVYALGLSMYKSLAAFDLSPAEMDIVKRALVDAAAGKPALEVDVWGPKIQPFAQARVTRASAAYLVKAAAQPGAVKTASGMIYRELRPGAGPSPKATDTVKVHYRGTLVSGTEFDSSYKRNEPTTFPLNHVIKCWTEGLQLMKTGGKAQLTCPSDLAYGETGNQGIPPGATLIFEIELLSIGGS